MNQFASASLQNGIIRYKHLTVGDVRPNATAKLYKRMFKGTGRKYIPVKDVTNDTMGRELNAYLINPQYIEKSVVSSELITRQLRPRPVVRVMQYSKLTYNHPHQSAVARATERTAVLFNAAVKVGQQTIALARRTVRRGTDTAFHAPFARTYSLRGGMAVQKRQKVFTGASSLAAIAGFGIISLYGINGQEPVVQPKPADTSATSSIQNPLVSAPITPGHSIPIFNTPAENRLFTPGMIETKAVTQSKNTTVTQLEASLALPAPAPVAQQLSGTDIVNERPNTTHSPILIDDHVVIVDTTGAPAPDTSIPTVTDPVDTTVDPLVDTTTQTLEELQGLIGGLL